MFRKNSSSNTWTSRDARIAVKALEAIILASNDSLDSSESEFVQERLYRARSIAIVALDQLCTRRSVELLLKRRAM